MNLFIIILSIALLSKNNHFNGKNYMKYVAHNIEIILISRHHWHSSWQVCLREHLSTSRPTATTHTHVSSTRKHRPHIDVTVYIITKHKTGGSRGGRTDRHTLGDGLARTVNQWERPLASRDLILRGHRSLLSDECPKKSLGVSELEANCVSSIRNPTRS